MSHAHRLVHHFGGDILRSEGMQREKHFRRRVCSAPCAVSRIAHSLSAVHRITLSQWAGSTGFMGNIWERIIFCST